MTRMTPTNDAPVTVEQAVENARWLIANDSDNGWTSIRQETLSILLEALASAPAPDWTIERDANGEAMVCTGCGTTRTVEHIRYLKPQALSCCPERKMIPVRDAIASAPAGDGVEDDAALLADANGWYSQAQVDDMERDSRGCLACKCGDYPRPSGNYVMPDDGWRSMWCQGCMEHVVGWCASEAEAIQKWNAQRSTELTTPPAAALARPRAAVGEREALATIAALLGNVDHSRPGGHGDALHRGGLLESIREIIDLALQSPPAKVEG